MKWLFKRIKLIREDSIYLLAITHKNKMGQSKMENS